MVLAVSYATVLPTRLVYIRFKMNFDAVDGDSKGTISSGLYVGF